MTSEDLSGEFQRANQFGGRSNRRSRPEGREFFKIRIGTSDSKVAVPTRPPRHRHTTHPSRLGPIRHRRFQSRDLDRAKIGHIEVTGLTAGRTLHNRWRSSESCDASRLPAIQGVDRRIMSAPRLGRAGHVGNQSRGASQRGLQCFMRATIFAKNRTYEVDAVGDVRTTDIHFEVQSSGGGEFPGKDFTFINPFGGKTDDNQRACRSSQGSFGSGVHRRRHYQDRSR